MDELGAFTPEQARLIWQDYQTRQQLNPKISQNFPQRRTLDEPSPHRVFVKNASGEAIPAFGCMEITGTEEVGERTVVTVTKPTKVDGEYLFNSQFEIATGGNGWAFRFGVVIMTGTAPTDPAQYRPIVASWDVEEGDGPFVVFGAHTVVDGALIGRFAGGASATVDPIEPNPGVARVKIDAVSACKGETFDELGFHAFLATITSRPFEAPKVDELRKESGGQVTVFDPSGCMLDATYEPEDFINAVAWVSLMFGGEIFDETYNFKSSSTPIAGDVVPADAFETFRPEDSCKPFGWVGGERTGYTASIGPIVPNGITTFQVRLPERGKYKITIVYGDATDATDNLLTLLDGDDLLATIANASEAGETFTHGPTDYIFKSTNRPLLKITLNNAEDRDSRIVQLVILQVDAPTQWEVINRCCIAKDTE